MPAELGPKLLAKLLPIPLEHADFGKGSQMNAIEVQLLRFAALSMDEETVALCEILQTIAEVA